MYFLVFYIYYIYFLVFYIYFLVYYIYFLVFYMYFLVFYMYFQFMCSSSLLHDPETHHHLCTYTDKLVRCVWIPGQLMGGASDSGSCHHRIIICRPHRQGIIPIITYTEVKYDIFHIWKFCINIFQRCGLLH